MTTYFFEGQPVIYLACPKLVGKYIQCEALVVHKALNAGDVVLDEDNNPFSLTANIKLPETGSLFLAKGIHSEDVYTLLEVLA